MVWLLIPAIECTSVSRSNHRVSVFTSEGQFVTSFGRRGQGPGEFNYPCGITVDNSGVVYVCDCRQFKSCAVLSLVMFLPNYCVSVTFL